MTHSALSRREVLQSAIALPFVRWLPGGDDLAIVVLELEGGNDGLNTLIPLQDASYRRARPELGAVRNGAHPIGDGYGLHPALAGLADLVQRGELALVHGVGYPRPDRSHFRSRDIWHVADPDYQRQTAATTGWLGRAADWLAERGAAVPGVGIGLAQLPLLLQGRQVVVPVLQRLEDYQLLVDPAGGSEAARRAALLELVEGTAEDTRGGDLARFLGEVAHTACAGAERLRRALQRYQPQAEYPDGALARDLNLVARMVVAGFGTRLFHVVLGGFDTHARQLPAHDALLRQLSSALTAFATDLRAQRALARTVVIVYSEFGRRLAQNQSLGTDHGVAGPVLLLGGGVKGGQHGRPPSLLDLDDGDLKPTCDFRELYGAVLRRCRIDPVAVLGQDWRGVDPW
jgi:uncharacterized protein (DUF1501 family)